MMLKVVAATRSAHKLAEIRRILAGQPGLEIVGPDDLGLEPDPAEDSIEVFETFEENALAKARWFQERTGLPALADDSGLMVDALGGAPGVRSKRFAPPELRGNGTVDEANNRHLLHRLKDLPPADRTARFVCVAVLDPGPDGGAPVVCRGEAPGHILAEPRGADGFGYDPLFLDASSGRSFAELTPQEKDARSHRGLAFRQMAERLHGLTSEPGEA